ncbi:MAG TPA: MlaD family protein [Solirubrobacteraceae bacterium]|nr:MlaD family protein [Solirubrobacteraceae bacterium]
MRRIALIAVVLIAVVGGAFVVSGASNGGGGAYRITAFFDDAAFAVPGEDIRIAGAPVGTISSMNVCTQSTGPCAAGTLNKAAVTFQITNPSFIPFRGNATCAIRPQSLIGEKYVDCNPGTSTAAPLTKIPRGIGAGSYMLPVSQTNSPVDTDLVQDIYREPVRQQFAIIINELGTGLAARGSDLNAVIHRANPALGYTDQVLQILARQNRQLAQLSRDSDAVLTPLAKDREAIKQFVIQANTTSVASAARAADVARSFHLLPTFLAALKPLEVDLAGLADQATPVLNSLSVAAPALTQQYEALAPFAGVARKSLIALGNASQQQQPALIATIPLAQRLLNFGNAGVPSFTALDKLTASLDKTGAIEQLMGVLFYGATATNGFDSLGHYIRTEALVGGCTGYAKVPVGGCSANFSQQSAAADIASATSPKATASAATGPRSRNTHTPDAKVLQSVREAQSSGIQASNTGALTGLLGYLIGNGR